MQQGICYVSQGLLNQVASMYWFWYHWYFHWQFTKCRVLSNDILYFKMINVIFTDGDKMVHFISVLTVKWVKLVEWKPGV